MCNVRLPVSDSDWLGDDKDNPKPKHEDKWRFRTKLDNLDFADDIALLSSTHTHMQQKTTNLSNFAKCVGLKINESSPNDPLYFVLTENLLFLYYILVIERPLYTTMNRDEGYVHLINHMHHPLGMSYI